MNNRKEGEPERRRRKDKEKSSEGRRTEEKIRKVGQKTIRGENEEMRQTILYDKSSRQKSSGDNSPHGGTEREAERVNLT